MPQLTRKLLLDTVHTALAGQPWVNALWEDGSAAFARDDQWSDVDLQAGLEDSHVAETFAVVEAALGKVAKTELIFAVPEARVARTQPAFLPLRGCTAVADPRFLRHPAGQSSQAHRTELHGTARVLFDLTGLFRQPPKIDRTALETKLQARLAQLTVRFEMFQVRVTKEVWRQHSLDAAYFYQT